MLIPCHFFLHPILSFYNTRWKNLSVFRAQISDMSTNPCSLAWNPRGFDTDFSTEKHTDFGPDYRCFPHWNQRWERCLKTPHLAPNSAKVDLYFKNFTCILFFHFAIWVELDSYIKYEVQYNHSWVSEFSWSGITDSVQYIWPWIKGYMNMQIDKAVGKGYCSLSSSSSFPVHFGVSLYLLFL